MSNRVLIAIPSKGWVSVKWVVGFHEFLKANEGNPYALEWNWGVAETRERLAEQFMSMEDCSHMLFLDDDIIPPIETIQKLLGYGKPIVSGVYLNSLHTGLNVWIDDKPLSQDKLKEMPEVFQVEKCGLGICLISRDVFKEIADEKPWFNYRVYTDNALSEDFYFFQKCRCHQIYPWIARDVKALHIKEFVVAPEGQGI